MLYETVRNKFEIPKGGLRFAELACGFFSLTVEFELKKWCFELKNRVSNCKSSQSHLTFAKYTKSVVDLYAAL